MRIGGRERGCDDDMDALLIRDLQWKCAAERRPAPLNVPLIVCTQLPWRAARRADASVKRRLVLRLHSGVAIGAAGHGCSSDTTHLAVLAAAIHALRALRHIVLDWRGNAPGRALHRLVEARVVLLEPAGGTVRKAAVRGGPRY